jgi:hypothetical protein
MQPIVDPAPAETQPPQLPEAFLAAIETLGLQKQNPDQPSPWAIILRTPGAQGLPFQVRYLALPESASALQLVGLFSELPANLVQEILGALNNHALLGRYLLPPFSVSNNIVLACIANLPLTPDLSKEWFTLVLRGFIADLGLLPLLIQKQALLHAKAPPQLN